MLQSDIIDDNMSVPADYIDLQLQKVKYTLKILNVNKGISLDGICSRILQAVYNIFFNLYVTNIIISFLLTLKTSYCYNYFKISWGGFFLSEHHSEFTIKYYGYPLLYIDNICIEMSLDVGGERYNRHVARESFKTLIDILC